MLTIASLAEYSAVFTLPSANLKDLLSVFWKCHFKISLITEAVNVSSWFISQIGGLKKKKGWGGGGAHNVILQFALCEGKQMIDLLAQPIKLN